MSVCVGHRFYLNRVHRPANDKMAIGKASIMQKWMTLTMTFLHVVVGDVGTNCSRPAQIRLALLQPFRGDKGFEQTAAAATMAIADAHSQGLLNGTEVR